MEELFEINAYRFIDKSSKLGMTIYSRSREYAEKIIGIHNICSCCHWVPQRRKFVKQIFVNRQPYELEQEQLYEAKQKLLKRQNNYAKKKKLEATI